MAETLEKLLDAPLHNAPFVIRNLLSQGGLLLIGAAPKTFKSLLACNIAFDLCEGVNMLGQEAWKVYQPHTVLLIEQEVGKFPLRGRFQKIVEGRGRGIAVDNLYWKSKDLEIQLDTPVGIGKFVHEIKQCSPSVVILDPLLKFHSRNNNDVTEMVKVYKTISKLSNDHGFSTIVVHHCGKHNDFRKDDDPEAILGSMASFAEADSVIMITRPVPRNKRIIKLSVRLRLDADPDPLLLELDADTYTFKERAE